MKRIGILAHSGEGAALCFLAAVHEGERRLGAHVHPDIAMDIEAMGASMADWGSGNLSPIRARFAKAATRLTAAGADFFVCPDNTAHLALETPGVDFPLPGLHIADVLAREAKRRGFSKIAITGTRWTMEGPIYPREFVRRGIDHLAPEKPEREIIQAIIFDELVRGDVKAGSRDRFASIVAELKAKGCDAVLLGCTELPMLLDDTTSPLPVLDSTRLLARAAVAVALDDEALPSWRAGPFAG
jgi:aspartate racemase